MLRYIDWPERLMLFLSERENQPMEWSKTNCCLTACDAVQAISGQDPAHFFRDKCNTPKQTYLLLKRFAGGGLEEASDKIFKDMGINEKPVEEANSGDVVLIDVENVHPDAQGLTMAVVIAKGVVAAQGKEGLVYINNPDIRKAWDI